MMQWRFLIIIGMSAAVFGQQCGRHSCHGDVGNLAAGRFIAVTSTCGEVRSEISCDPGLETCSSPSCRRCKAGRAGHEHPSSHMFDSPFFRPHTWWQSANNADDVTLRFDLETTFYFTHLIMLFRSPRPGAMTLERSLDHGKSWKIYQRFARNCSKTFGMEDDVEMDGAKCTSRYSDPTPCHKGEVIYRVLNPTDPIDPYSDEARHLLKITNLRIRMWEPQTCPSCVNGSSHAKINARGEGASFPPNLRGSYTRFAVYDVIVRGTCFCNGHADTCVPFYEDGSEPRDDEQSVVHGKCICEHNTAGDHCQKCLPLYNDAPWKAGNGDTGAANPCKRCSCHGHANSCKFNEKFWLASRNRSGGVCEECQHNTEGRHCEHCKPGHFRRVDSELSDPDVCQECLCNPVGTANITSNDDSTNTVACNSATGQCKCKPGVGGRRCDRCLKRYWGFSMTGCNECLCDRCEQKTGVCLPDYGDDDISFIDVFTEEKTPGYDLSRHSLDNFEYFQPYTSNRFQLPRFPDDDDNLMLPVYPVEPLTISRSPVDVPEGERDVWHMSSSWHPTRKCTCQENNIEDESYFCKMKYDYAVKVRMRVATDYGTHTTLLVSVRRVIKEGKVKIHRRKTVMHPESWTIMGCTCPVLMPGHDYLVVGHEDPINNRLMINVQSIVKDWWSKGKNWPRYVKKLFRKKC